MKRKDNEKFEAYKNRRQADKILTDMKLAWKFVWVSTGGILGLDKRGIPIRKTFIKSRDALVNSREFSAPDAPKRPAGDQAHNHKVDVVKPTKAHPDIDIYQQELPWSEKDD